ncbi:dihydroneopterin aldolase [Candidatus Endowatersipora endosymbiont of Watersipora subatra]|uniref:dihydroneopterin aldolase n=1 Tax=Candidatus Endowatersipora endosymbiont of Watersipora subatra TaxID=3077946 RepID=UPI00312C81D7
MYEITLKNCTFFAHHGVYEEEKKLGQRFFVDTTLKVDSWKALHEDRIEDTVHYGNVFGIIEGIMITSRRYLIEALAMDIAKGLCDKFPEIVQVKVTLKKPHAPVYGILDHVGVTVYYPEGN